MNYHYKLWSEASTDYASVLLRSFRRPSPISCYHITRLSIRIYHENRKTSSRQFLILFLFCLFFMDNFTFSCLSRFNNNVLSLWFRDTRLLTVIELHYRYSLLINLSFNWCFFFVLFQYLIQSFSCFDRYWRFNIMSFVRVKRRHNEDPFNSILISHKKLKTVDAGFSRDCVFQFAATIKDEVSFRTAHYIISWFDGLLWFLLIYQKTISSAITELMFDTLIPIT